MNFTNLYSILNEDLTTILRHLGIKVTTEVPKGPTYILQDGNFVDLHSSKLTTHSALDNVLSETGLFDINDKTNIYRIPMDMFNAIRCNDGQNFAFEVVVELPNNPINSKQLNSLLKWLDYIYTQNKPYLYVSSTNNKKSKLYHLDNYTADELLKIIDIYSRTGRLNESIEEDIDSNYLKDKDGNPKLMYHGSSANFSRFKNTINWFTDNLDYAKQYALWLHTTPKIYEAYLKINNPFDCGYTSQRCYMPYPMFPPYNFTNELSNLIKRLGITEEEARQTLLNIAVDYNLTPKEELGMHIHVLTRTKEFADWVKAKGYDSIIAIEDGDYCVGVFNPDDIIIQKKINLEG